jgi:hypothetical protein
MGVTLQTESDNVKVFRVRGLLKKKEFDEAIACEADRFRPGDHVRVLIIADHFLGLEKIEAWADGSFFIKYADLIDKIAIVGEPTSENDLMVFASADFRRVPIKFFCWPNITAAREWLKKDNAE